jgi:hypothetical protein
MLSAIIIAPSDLLPQADAFAVAVGLPTGQFTVGYGGPEESSGFRLCHFPPSDTALAALDGTLPDWLQVVFTDSKNSPQPWDETKVGVFLSATEDGWRHKATVDSWPRG